MDTKKKTEKFILFVIGLFLLGSCAEFKGIFDEGARSSRGPQSVDDLASTRAAKTDGSGVSVRAPIMTREGTYYFVKTGDSLAQIAHKYHIDWEAIAQINSIGEDQLVVGRRIFIPHKKNLSRFGVVPRAISSTRKQQQKDSRMARANAEKSPSKQLKFAWPVDGGYVSSRFGHRRGRPHDAIDIAAKPGTAVFAAEAGKVIFAKRFAGYGNLVVVKHRDDYFTAYAHNQDMFVRKGQKVRLGQRIAVVGRTGRATGPHLHFEVRHGTQAVDPIQFFPDRR